MLKLTEDLIAVGVTAEELAEYEPHNIVIHPGEHIRDDLDALGWSASQLARALDVPTNRITAILNGQRGITADTAIRLSRWLGTSPEFWLNLQKQYELDLAQVTTDESAYDTVVPLERADVA